MAKLTNNIKRERGKLHPLSPLKSQFGHIAMAYYPELGYKAALRMFRKEIEQSPKLYEELKALGYKGNERILSLRQLKAIEMHLGGMEDYAV